MSLTRDEWVQMWNSVKRLESVVKNSFSLGNPNRKLALEEIEKVKQQIQSVIGQME